jgi:hypothetical protein
MYFIFFIQFQNLVEREILSKSNQSKIIGVANFVHKIHILNKLAFITVLGFMLIHEPNGSLENASIVLLLKLV